MGRHWGFSIILFCADELAEKFEAYRRRRKQETGKVMQRQTAACELLEKALTGVEPPKPLEDRLIEIETGMAEIAVRLTSLEASRASIEARMTRAAEAIERMPACQPT